jgi:hypothetical protein
MNSNSSVLGTDRGHDQGTATPPPDNGADGQGKVSTGGGPPWARVRGQHGQEYMRQGSGVYDQEVALGMEPDDNLWGCLVHPPQLQCISHMAWEHIDLSHVDIQGVLEPSQTGTYETYSYQEWFQGYRAQVT